jgi:hypothetical protein
MPEAYWTILGFGVAGAVVVLLWRPVRSAFREARFSRARREFRPQRERLEAKFVQLACSEESLHAPHWVDCEFGDDVAFVRNRLTGELAAFVAVTVATDEPDDLAPFDSDAVGNLRAGTAVFRFDRTHWDTDGRAILNLSPAEAIRAYEHSLEVVGQQLTHRGC